MMELQFPTSDALPNGSVAGRTLCAYTDALTHMETLVSRPRHAPDVLLCVEHPPTITLGRRGGEDSILGRTLHLPGQTPYPVAVHRIARGHSESSLCGPGGHLRRALPPCIRRR